MIDDGHANREVHLSDVPGSVPCRVIAKLQRTRWRVIIGVGVGHLNGGFDDDISEEELPIEVRRPNAVFWLRIARPVRR